MNRILIYITEENTVKLLNMALESADQEKFYEILQSPYLEISHYIDEYAVPLYYQEMKDDRIESHVSSYICNLS